MTEQKVKKDKAKVLWTEWKKGRKELDDFKLEEESVRAVSAKVLKTAWKNGWIKGRNERVK